jgi:hypothetical protein
MIEQIKYSGFAAITAASGGAAIINEATLLPMSIFLAGISGACFAAWRVSAAVTKASDRLARMEERLDKIEQKCYECNQPTHRL